LVFRQLICQFDPNELAAYMSVVLRRELVWGIETASGDVDFLREIFVLEG